MKPFKPPQFINPRSSSKPCSLLPPPPSAKREPTAPLENPTTKTPRLTTTTSENGLTALKKKPPISSTGFKVKRGSPLIPVRIIQPASTTNTQSEASFSVVYRKSSNKKHKTWEGDGVLIITPPPHSRLLLKDMTGKDIASASYTSVCIGDELRIGAKEIEVMGVVAYKDILSGRVFLEAGSSAATHNHPTTTSLAPKQFKSLATGTPIPLKPRHDPSNPSSLVLPSPPNLNKSKYRAVVVDPAIAQHLRPHQREGVRFLYECVMGYRGGFGAILADEMGLGKTIQAIALCWTLLKQSPLTPTGVATRILIICPATLLTNWQSEFRKWLGDERCRVYLLSEKQDFDGFLKARVWSVCVASYEKIRALGSDLRKAKFDLVICDEGHRLKSTQIKTSQVLQTLSTSRRIILSGTPLQNDLSEFFAMIDFVQPGRLGPYKTFKRIFEDAILAGSQSDASEDVKEIAKKRFEELKIVTDAFVLRRTKEINEKYLPPKRDVIIFVTPSPLQQRIYKSILSSTHDDLEPAFVLGLITRLKKLCNSPSLLSPEESGQDVPSTPSTTLTSPKLQVLEALLTEFRSRGEKCVVVSHSTKMLDLIEKTVCRELEVLRLDGSTPAPKRQPLVDKFNDPSSRPTVFLLSSKAGGMGINLIGASRLILVDVDWNPSIEAQAMARIWRQGQVRDVTVYRLLISGSIEEKIHQRQLTKLSLSANIVDGAAHSPSTFTASDLKDLFTFHENEKCLTHALLLCSCGAGEPENLSASKATKDLGIDELLDWTHVSIPVPNHHEPVDKVTDLALSRVVQDLGPEVIGFLFIKDGRPTEIA